MTRLFSTIWIILLTSIGCESLHNESDKIPDGLYIGTFQRQLAFGGGDTAHVTITFSSGSWTGQSDKPNYPALCHGTYKIEAHKIIFTNNCVFTADFDWTLILSGNYDFTLNGNQIKIVRSDLGPTSDTWIDNYTLTKQE